MKQEDQNIAIAEAHGYRMEKFTGSSFPFTIVNPHGIRCVPYSNEEQAWCRNCPDYLNDLNAMHEAKKVLQEEERCRMLDKLCEIVRRDHDIKAGPMTAIIEAFYATAAQEAEAFLKTIGKWRDE